MRLDYYLCIDPNKGFIIDSDDEAPLLSIEFFNEATALTEEGKLAIMEAMTNVFANKSIEAELRSMYKFH